MSLSLYCSRCGCTYMRRSVARAQGIYDPPYVRGREVGEVCGDLSGGINRYRPCDGVMEESEYTEEIRVRQARSFLMSGKDLAGRESGNG